MNKLISISGPTAVGKTKFSIDLAKKINCEIISFDSRQFYREMSIGTAVPKKNELIQVKHHFIQHKSIHDYYNINQFSIDAKKKDIRYLDLFDTELRINPISYGVRDIIREWEIRNNKNLNREGSVIVLKLTGPLKKPLIQGIN